LRPKTIHKFCGQILG